MTKAFLMKWLSSLWRDNPPPKKQKVLGEGNTIKLPANYAHKYRYIVEGNANCIESHSDMYFSRSKFSITGSSNMITLEGATTIKFNCRIEGDGTCISFAPGSASQELKIVITGSGNRLLVGKHCSIGGLIIIKGNSQTIHIDDYTTIVDGYMLAQEGCDISIGKHCMFSRGIEIRTTDAHSLIDLETGLRTNLPGPVTIGSHVWLAANVFVSKGVTIADNCVVGAGAVVVKDLTEPDTLYGGVPASIIRQGITWNRKRKKKFSRREMNDWKKDVEDCR